MRRRDVLALLALSIGTQVSPAGAQMKPGGKPFRIGLLPFSSGYPVEAGLAQSLARPGRNVTGNSIYAGTGVFGKLLELLREAKPGTNRIGVLWGYVPPAFPQEEIKPVYDVIQRSARALGMKVHIVEVPRLEHIAGALAAVEADQSEGLLITGSFASAAPRAELARQTANYVDRILKGASPGEIPIQYPAKFELVINLRTAKAMGLTIPRSLLLRADQIVDS